MIALKSNILLILCISSIQISFAQFPSRTFSCDNGEYIESDQYCDGYLQCSDGSDEPDICSSTERVCGPGKYLCPTTRSCIDADLVSDVHVLKYCPSNGNHSDSNETVGLFNIMSTWEHVFNRDATELEKRFHCSVQKCYSVHFLCDGYCECADCSDETSVPDDEASANVIEELTNCTYEDSFRCDDNKRCLNLDYACDGYCNCFDCSDEYGDCLQVDREKLSDCPNSYLPTPQGARCLGSSNSHDDAETKLTTTSEECNNEHICDQECSMFRRKAICSCYDDYTKVPSGENGFRCQSKVSSLNTLVYSTTTQIKLLNLTTGRSTVIEEPLECVALTAAHDHVYYTTYSNSIRSIFMHSLSSRKTTEIKLNILLDSPINSIAVDYITDNLYFTTKTTLSVCSNNTENRICMQIKCCDVNYVALAPSYGWMFYTKASSRKDERLIMRSNMDGSDEHVLIDGSFPFSNLLAVDESIKRVYWLDPEITGNKKLLSASFYGGVNEIRKFQYLGVMMSITALDSRIFFTRTRDNQIYILENKENFTKSIDENAKITRYHSNVDSSGLLRSSSNSAERLIEGNLTFSVQQLHAYNPFQQNNHEDKNPCARLETPCTGLCLLRPTNSTNKLGYTCSCNSSNSLTNPYWCGRSASVIPETSSQRSSASLINSRDESISFDQSSNHFNSKQPEPENSHTGFMMFGAIVLVALVLGGGYVVYDKRKQNSLNFAQRHSNERVNLYDQNEL